ncbi:TMEM150B isoform 5 [Pan troglodytes]|uniref:TMEM150B isoform 4 n=1 Tax=Pan troglodytes TaxID=9598 RepID=A0A2J8IWV5_PANTR|nr:TMEM150B isoform 4 [Pan troglodytes]PNI15004.1 TMEM150B isoform 5 [Pan troglodytes]
MWGYLSLMPVFLAVWAISGVWIVFAIAVTNRTVDLSKGFPYISRVDLHCPLPPAPGLGRRKVA